MHDNVSLVEKEFRKNFECWKEKRIVLYGAGRLTQKLLPRIKDYNIVGILDGDLEKVGTSLENVPVYRVEEDVLESYADCIIINTTEIYWRQISAKLEKIKIPVYYRNGEKAVGKIERTNILEMYFEKKLSKNQKQVLELLKKMNP